MYGMTAGRREISDGEVRLDVIVPPDAFATIHPPGAAELPVAESGTPVHTADGHRNVKVDQGSRIVEIGSGLYTFT
jgi:hypothetical protein